MTAKTETAAEVLAHPIQPLQLDERGTLRFKRNAIVRHLLDHGGIDLNAIACMDFSREDREQFAQLIGYSHDGAGTLSYFSDEVWESARDEYENRGIERALSAQGEAVAGWIKTDNWRQTIEFTNLSHVRDEWAADKRVIVHAVYTHPAPARVTEDAAAPQPAGEDEKEYEYLQSLADDPRLDGWAPEPHRVTKKSPEPAPSAPSSTCQRDSDEPPPVIVCAAVIVAAEQLATIAADYLRRAEDCSVVDAIDEGAGADDDEPSKALRQAITQMQRALAYPAPSAQPAGEEDDDSDHVHEYIDGECIIEGCTKSKQPDPAPSAPAAIKSNNSISSNGCVDRSATQEAATITPEREAMSRMKDAAIEAHRLCYEAMLANPEVVTLSDDGELHKAIHAIVGVETPSYMAPADVQALARLIANDGFACSFQSMSQYRGALLREAYRLSGAQQAARGK